MIATATWSEAAANGATKKRQRRCKAAGGMNLGKENGREAQRVAAVILEVLAGARTPQQAATALSISLPYYYHLETKALQGLVEACEPKPRGRAPNLEKELTGLRRQQERLQRELTRQQSLVRMAQRTMGLNLPKEQPATATGKGKRRRRRPVVRALGAAKHLQERSKEAEAPTAGEPESSA
jgi:hypothetical protein